MEHILEYPKIATEYPPMPLRCVRDRFRCADEFLKYRLSGDLSQDCGYFVVSNGAICYGRSVGATHRAKPAYCPPDSVSNVGSSAGQLVLPFDPDEVIDNLRLERYPGSQIGKYEKVLKTIYYWLRPLTTGSLRRGTQRFRAGNLEKMRFPQWPVDTTVEGVCENLLSLAMRASGIDHIPFIWFWPDGARGCVSMTHDIETVAGRDFCPELLDIDDSFGIKASFQVVPEKRYPVTPEFLSRIRARGFELGVQDLNHDGRLFDSRGEFRRRADLINGYGCKFGARGFRSGVLYRHPEWYEDSDFSFDMSIPNVAHLDPQRGGCCTVMPYFIGDVLELPLTTIQDYTLFHVLNERSIDLWKIQIERILAKNGLATFLVHPDYIIEPETQAVYKELLAFLGEMRKKEALWFALPFEVDRWWRARSQMSIVKDGKSWRIVGKGAERAVLAFAKVVDGQLIYELVDAPQGEVLQVK